MFAVLGFAHTPFRPLFPLRMPDEVNTSVEFKSRNCGNRAIVGAKPSQFLHNWAVEAVGTGSL
jgi:hypothetical protein